MIEKIIRKPVTVMIVFILFVMLGIFCGKNLSLDMFPETNNPSVMITTTCGNADPSEVERNVTRKLESAFSGLSGLKHMTSESSTGYSSITLEFSSKTNMDSAMIDVREKIDRARGDLPEQAGNPNALQLDASLISLMTLVMKGDHSPSELYEYADDIVAPSLEQIDGIASCDIHGGEEKCIRVSVSLDRLEAYSLSLNQVRQSLASQNLESSAGVISAGKTNYTVSADGAFRSIEDLGNTVISYKKPYSGGEALPIYLRDIADIKEDSKDVYSIAYLDGVPCIMFTLQKQGGRNSVAAAHSVRKAMPSILAQLPDDIEIIETANNTDIIESTVSEVISSVVTGAILAILVLFLFLKNFKSTLIIGLSIPVSIIITLVFMYFRGTSLNLISLSGLLLGVGMLVDNSIVVLENIYTHASKGESPLESSLNGAKEMVMPVISSTLTSVCIFVPMLAFGSLIGIIGEAFLDLGFAISIALICSLFTSIILVPVLAAYYLKVNPKTVLEHKNNESSKTPHKSIGERIYAAYARAVRWILHHKAISFGFLIILFVLAMLSLPGRGFILLPSNPETQVKVQMTLAKGTSLEETESQIKELERLALEGLEGVTFSNVSVGGTTAASSNIATLLLSLSGPYSSEAKEVLRNYFDNFPGAQFEFQATSLSLSSGFSGGSGGYVLEMHSNDMEVLSLSAGQILNLIKDQASDIVSEVSSDILSGMPEVKIRIDREAINSLGLSINTIASELRAAVSGVEAGTFEQEGKDTDIIVTLDKSDKQRVSDLNKVFVINQNGDRIPLSAVAYYEETTSPSSINRKDQTRTATVTAVPKKGIPLTVVQKRIDSLIEDNLVFDDSLSFAAAGDFSEMLEMGKGFIVIIIMAMLLVFAVIASQFESLKDPFIIYFTIPLSFIGVAAIYAMVGQPLSMMSVLGVLMLVGVIVNNGIVLVDAANSLRKEGFSLEEACVESARSRLRPIMMSTLTTLISLIPMALFPSEGAVMIQPINLTVLGGLGFGTMMTLFIMPAVYYVFNVRNSKK
ncbi:MAG: efflux RND transporter permease subunit [Treponema sp.]|nr:efflux RND transporter permease subunit [Treponema sp.]